MRTYDLKRWDFGPTMTLTRYSGFQDQYCSEPGTDSEQARCKSIDRGAWAHPVYIPCYA